MTLVEFLLLLAIAAVAGAIGQAIAGYSVGGCIGSIVVGFLGAYVGSWLASEFHLPEFLMIDVGGRGFPIIWAVIGAALLSAGLGWISRRRRLI